MTAYLVKSSIWSANDHIIVFGWNINYFLVFDYILFLFRSHKAGLQTGLSFPGLPLASWNKCCCRLQPGCIVAETFGCGYNNCCTQVYFLCWLCINLFFYVTVQILYLFIFRLHYLLENILLIVETAWKVLCKQLKAFNTSAVEPFTL